jgi:hypothetical protein
MVRKSDRLAPPIFHQLVVGGQLNFAMKSTGEGMPGVSVKRQLTMPGLNIEQSYSVDSQLELNQLLQSDEFFLAHPVFFKLLEKEALKYL